MTPRDDTEPRPAPIGEAAASAVRTAGGVHEFVASAYEANHAELFAFLARATRDRSVAEELLLRTFLQLTGEARAGRAPADVRRWLYRTATDSVIARARGQARALRWLGRARLDDLDETVSPTAEAGVLSRERAAEMERVLGGLSTDARLALLLSGEGFAGDEIAAAIGRTAAGTRTLLSRARARVRIRRDLFAEDAR